MTGMKTPINPIQPIFTHIVQQQQQQKYCKMRKSLHAKHKIDVHEDDYKMQ